MDLDKIPAVPEDLVEYLEKTYTPRSLKPTLPVNEIYAHLGRLDVVLHLRTVCDKQNPLLQ